ncbi:recombinase family protein [Pseudomonas haemolytica]|uniref:Recombinase family protein n=1 Tax=Pseudomonas haemolytica TaxID=2600065 RepID=A0A5P1D6Y5_9PSED|nr:recombinase family protein [Pseudomonas haemolytica]MBJ2247382.1 recombinase family protein [Pseudomonas haemolytica]MBJ2272192.1 recombinase family protein [Pseudomonas haemolytica]MBK3450134.1 recombinase family protein [Pseudomonas haemolytica]MBK3461715.1 recombinase family protein [Pseudomonas haemolytica]MRJ36194.1 serine recombinase [Pseudomonas haemolytica]
MMIRAYLRASTNEQDASRARADIKAFADQHGQRIASYYTENESGATLQRPELMRLLADCEPGDVLLVEQVDRLSRLTEADWQALRAELTAKGVLVVALDLPTSHGAMAAGAGADDFTTRMLGAVNAMLLDMLAAVARKDYEDRRRRQAQGIEKAKAGGAYKGRATNEALHSHITELLKEGKSIRKVAGLLGCSTNTVQRVRQAVVPVEA